MSDSEDKLKELLSRNDQLAIELHHIRNENNQLKQKLSGIMSWSLFHSTNSKPFTFERGSQTDTNADVIENKELHAANFNVSSSEIDTMPQQFKEVFAVSNKNEDQNVYTHNDMPFREQAQEPSPGNIMECSPSSLSESDENIYPFQKNQRAPRNTRKPITYQEPSLRAKVRKGFQYFKFENTSSL